MRKDRRDMWICYKPEEFTFDGGFFAWYSEFEFLDYKRPIEKSALQDDLYAKLDKNNGWSEYNTEEEAYRKLFEAADRI